VQGEAAKKLKGWVWVLLWVRYEPRPEVRRTTTNPNAYVEVSNHHALRALQVSHFVQNGFELRVVILHIMILRARRAPDGAVA